MPAVSGVRRTALERTPNGAPPGEGREALQLRLQDEANEKLFEKLTEVFMSNRVRLVCAQKVSFVVRVLRIVAFGLGEPLLCIDA